MIEKRNKQLYDVVKTDDGMKRKTENIVKRMRHFAWSKKRDIRAQKRRCLLISVTMMRTGQAHTSIHLIENQKYSYVFVTVEAILSTGNQDYIGNLIAAITRKLDMNPRITK